MVRVIEFAAGIDVEMLLRVLQPAPFCRKVPEDISGFPTLNYDDLDHMTSKQA
jgi:hypothetical protein